MKKRRLIPLSIVLILLVLYIFFIFKAPILRQFSNYLISETKLYPADGIFVLSGAPHDRAVWAEHLYRQGYSDRIFCTGSIVPQDFKAMGMMMAEGQITRNQLRRLDVEDERIIWIDYGTSTKEEADTILGLAKSMGMDTILIVSSKFHTRRVSKTFKKRFEKEGIYVMISGAPASAYNERIWWKSEQGLIALNNEYVKLLYYAFRY